jgi:rhodanese-related sulfurtransferase
MPVDELLARARSVLRRVEVTEAEEAVRRGAVLVDIRSEVQRDRDGVIPAAVFIPRNVLEWRTELLAGERRVVLMCDAGYQSSLAAVALQELGLEDATDLDGGFQAWRGAGLPVDPLA